MTPESKKTIDEKLTVDFIGYSEPNNGRELWKVNIFHDNSNINNKIFVYIPVEGTAKLLNIDTLKVYDLPYKGVSTVSFIGNVFSFGKLMEIYFDLIRITDLSTLKITTVE